MKRITETQRAFMMIKKAQGIGTMKTNQLMSELKDISVLYTDLPSVKSYITAVLGEKCYSELLSARNGIDFSEAERDLELYGISIIDILQKEYPNSLKLFEDSPMLLYCKGNLSLLQTQCFAIVGTRYPTRYGLRATSEFAEALSKKFTIVSGLARGIDAASHAAALQAGENTVAVLGCGVEQCYPYENLSLYKEIAEKGLIISEYPIGTPAVQHHFPARNRIISGLSEGVLVTEAGEKSGTMLTVDHALNQGKEVFCIPGSIFSKTSAGCNRLLKNGGHFVTEPNDIISFYGYERAAAKSVEAMQLDVTEEMLLRLLEGNGEMHFEELLEEVDMTVSQLNSLLAKMQAKGLVNKNANNYWSAE